uniref:cholecystokinin receptor type A-like n=1 Tax=Myxine glutinosa TaxID=7769 RepID=UPI00358FC214
MLNKTTSAEPSFTWPCTMGSDITTSTTTKYTNGSTDPNSQKNSSHCRGLAPTQDIDSMLRIVLYLLIFITSVVGNAIILIVLGCNRRLRTVTNTFLLSLAVSDLLLALFCMPFNLIPSLLKDFIFGWFICRSVAYLMGISVSVSTFSLVAISLERYGAICDPLRSRSWQTRSHASRVVCVTWLLSLALMVPYILYSQLLPFKKDDGSTGHTCRMRWPSCAMQHAWPLFLLIVLFFLPGVIMLLAYSLISWELYRGIRFDTVLRRETQDIHRSMLSTRRKSNDGQQDTFSMNSGHADNPSSPDNDKSQLDRSIFELKSHNRTVSEASSTRTRLESQQSRARSTVSETNLLLKKRVIRMLATIVVAYFLCWTPLYSVNVWRAFDRNSAHCALSGAPISFIKLLSYTSSAVNPIIYCFMNRRFRNACFVTLRCGHAVGNGSGGIGGGGRMISGRESRMTRTFAEDEIPGLGSLGSRNNCTSLTTVS